MPLPQVIGAGVDRRRDLIVKSLPRPCRDQRPQVDLDRPGRIAEPQGASVFGESVGPGLDLADHVNAFDRHTRLTAIDERGPGQGARRGVKGGVGQDDGRVEPRKLGQSGNAG